VKPIRTLSDCQDMIDETVPSGNGA